ncbi:hypothetical protein FRB93_011917 [Tulasnella sp. JGI-2019a]|nr:hypothetical protein FRB93_011917 [Tulasnella sp. JGI-2019a]
MPVITDLTDLQRGTLWGEYAEALLIGIYTCLLIVTLWKPIESKRPLTLIGWTIIVIYVLSILRVVACFWVLYRSLFINGGEILKLESTDYVLRGVQEGLAFIGYLVSDGLFCWRLYVIWSRNIRIILLPALLLVVTVVGFTIIVVTDFLSAARPDDLRYITLNLSVFIWVLAVVLAYTCYITIFIAGRLWWVGRATNKISTLGEKKRHGYQGAINAIVQSGVIYVITTALTIVSVATMNTAMMTIIGSIGPTLSGICATLLVLQLNMYQDRAKRVEDSKRSPMTGASIQFANPQGTSSSTSAEWTHSPVMRRRRASIATCQHRECEKDIMDASDQRLVTFSPSATTTNDRICVPTLPYSPITSIRETKETSMV